MSFHGAHALKMPRQCHTAFGTLRTPAHTRAAPHHHRSSATPHPHTNSATSYNHENGTTPYAITKTASPRTITKTLESKVSAVCVHPLTPPRLPNAALLPVHVRHHPRSRAPRPCTRPARGQRRRWAKCQMQRRESWCVACSTFGKFVDGGSARGRAAGATALDGTRKAALPPLVGARGRCLAARARAACRHCVRRCRGGGDVGANWRLLGTHRRY